MIFESWQLRSLNMNSEELYSKKSKILKYKVKFDEFRPLRLVRSIFYTVICAAPKDFSYGQTIRLAAERSIVCSDTQTLYLFFLNKK